MENDLKAILNYANLDEFFNGFLDSNDSIYNLLYSLLSQEDLADILQLADTQEGTVQGSDSFIRIRKFLIIIIILFIIKIRLEKRILCKLDCFCDRLGISKCCDKCDDC